jgi:hypothetical protein
LGYQTPNKDLKGLFHQSNSESGGDEHRKKLYVMYGSSSELVSRWDVKTLRREVLSVKPATPKEAPPTVEEHHHLLRAVGLPREHGGR